MEKIPGYLRFLVYLLLLLAFGLLLAPCDAEAAQGPVSRVILVADPVNGLQGHSGHPGEAVRVTGQFAVDRLCVCRPVVRLSAMTDVGWPATIDPELSVITSTTPRSFAATVEIPAGTPADYRGTLIITTDLEDGDTRSIGRWRIDVGVRPRIDIRLSAEPACARIGPGEKVCIDVLVQNLGCDIGELNAVVTMMCCEFDEIEEWRITHFSKNDSGLKGNESRTIKVFFQAPERFNPYDRGLHDVTLEVFGRVNASPEGPDFLARLPVLVYYDARPWSAADTGSWLVLTGVIYSVAAGSSLSLKLGKGPHAGAPPYGVKNPTNDLNIPQIH